MELRHLRYFAVVSEAGSFHRASTILRVAQPALSRQIRDLEEELGTPLLVRSVKGVKLSPAGRVLLAEAKGLLAGADFALTRTRRAALGQFGVVRIAYTSLIAEFRFAMAAFAQARRLLPDIDFHLSIEYSEDQLSALLAGKIDVGLLHRRVPFPPEIAYRTLRVDAYRLVVPDDHPLTRIDNLRLADLARYDMAFVSYAGSPVFHTEVMSACLKGGLSPKIVVDFSSEAIFLNLVSEGIAIGFAHASLRERRPTTGLTYLTVNDLDFALDMSIAWDGRVENPAIMQFIDLMLQYAGETSYSQ